MSCHPRTSKGQRLLLSRSLKCLDLDNFSKLLVYMYFVCVCFTLFPDPDNGYTIVDLFAVMNVLNKREIMTLSQALKWKFV